MHDTTLPPLHRYPGAPLGKRAGLAVLKLGKQALLRAARSAGAVQVVAASPWRTRRLVILGYHGVALNDEHRWQPRLYLQLDTFRRRLAWLRRERYAVLPLAEGVSRLVEGSLPRRAVVLTFDDGFYDFLIRAYPLLQEFECPATLYMSTWHTGVREPVPELMLRYLLWKGSAAGVSEEWRETEARAVERQRATGGGDRGAWPAVLRGVAEAHGLDYDAILASRILQFMRPDEISGLDRALISVGLHTHRHRVPRDEALFRRELRDNRAAITAILGTNTEPRHFCYPSGEHYPEQLPWLRDEGILSATTCEPGIAAPRSEPLLLPRFLDGNAVTDDQFASWISGLSDLLPRSREPGFVPPLR